MAQAIKMERQDVMTLKPGDQIWIMDHYDAEAEKRGVVFEPVLLFVIKQLPDYEGGPRVWVNDTRMACPLLRKPEDLQKDHDKWIEQYGVWELKPFDEEAQRNTLFFAEERFDPTRYVDWENIAWHIPREWPAFWDAYVKWTANESDEALFRAFLSTCAERRTTVNDL